MSNEETLPEDPAMFTKLIAELDHIRQTDGDEAWQAAIRKYIEEGAGAGKDPRAFIAHFTRHAAELLRQKIADGAPKPVEKDQSPPPETAPLPAAEEVPQGFAEALHAQLPGLKSQAQYNAFMLSFEAYRNVITAILTDAGVVKETEAVKLLTSSFETVRKATQLTRQLGDVPEAAASRAADDFKNPPAQFTEYDKQRKLLSELEGLQTFADLSDWYKTNRKRIDEVVSATIRNPLLDAIRAKKQLLAGT